MKERCLNPNHKRYSHYGGRGIIICDRWINSFENFLNDMGERPKDLTLDRINPNGNYEPNNCRWANKFVQAANRTNNSSTPGVYWEKDKSTWRASLTVNGKHVIHKRFKDKDEALAARTDAYNKWVLNS